MLSGKPARVVAYRLVSGQGFPVDAALTSVTLTPNAHIPLREIMSGAVYGGTATSVPTYSKIASYFQEDGDGKMISHSGAAPALQYSDVSASIVPAGVVETAGEAPTEIPFPAPVALSGLASFILIFYPLPRASDFGISVIAESSVEIYVD
jgi:hypothetical protein